MQESKSCALPLGYSPMVAEGGLEPPSQGYGPCLEPFQLLCYFGKISFFNHIFIRKVSFFNHFFVGKMPFSECLTQGFTREVFPKRHRTFLMTVIPVHCQTEIVLSVQFQSHASVVGLAQLRFRLYFPRTQLLLS